MTTETQEKIVTGVEPEAVTQVVETQVPGLQGPQGEKGERGTTFTPTITTAGWVMWTNDGGEKNPTPVCIMGPKGDKGEQGEQGERGEKGETGKFDPDDLKALQAAKASAEASANTATEQAGIATEKAEEAKDAATVNRIVGAVSGEGMVRVDNSANYQIESLTIYGKSTQEGTPTLDDPKEIIDVVNPTISIYGRNLAKATLPYKASIDNGNITIITGSNKLSYVNVNQWNSFYGKRVASKCHVSLKNAVFSADDSGSFTRVGFEGSVTLDNGKRYYQVGTWLTIQSEQYGASITKEYDLLSINTLLPSGKAVLMHQMYIYIQGCISGEIEVTNIQIEVLPDYVQTASDYETYKAEQMAIANYTLRSLGNYKDELIVRSDGTGQYIKRIEKCYVLRGQGSYLTGVSGELWTKEEARFMLADSSVFGTYPNGLKFDFGTIATFCAAPFQAFRSSPPYLGLRYSLDFIKEKYGLTWSVPPTSEEINAIAIKLKETILSLGDDAYCYAVYQTPVITELTKEQVDEILLGLKSNKPTTTIINDQGFEMKIEYTCDPKNYIDQKISELQALTLEN